MGEPAPLGVNVLQPPEFEPRGGGQSGDGVAADHGPPEPRAMPRPALEPDPVPAPARPGRDGGRVVTGRAGGGPGAGLSGGGGHGRGWGFDLDDDGAVG